MRAERDAKGAFGGMDAPPILILLSSALLFCGCSRAHYRADADREVYGVIAERDLDPRWGGADPRIDIDPRSRYFDPYDPDCPPMPMDDPISQTYMHQVDGKRGWARWHDFGHRAHLENPDWRSRLAEYVSINAQGEVQLDIDSALRLAYIHSPNHQRQLETLYLTALDVTAERFRLDAQFFGGYDANYSHVGSLMPASLRFDPDVGRYVVTPPTASADSNQLTVGRPESANPVVSVEKQFATAGQLLVGFANSFVFEFTGSNANLSASLANFTFIQPLLRGAGRDIALEQLTQNERNLLANLRAYGQFRQGFFTQVAIGEIGVAGPDRFGQGTRLNVFGGRAPVGGYAGLLQQLQEIRNSEDNLSLQVRTLAQLEERLAGGEIDLVQVDQFRQSIENERARLLRARNDYLFALDVFKTSTLGLPPNLPVELDDSLIQQFQLIPRLATELQDRISELQDRVGDKIPDELELPADLELSGLGNPLAEPASDVDGALRAAPPDLDEPTLRELLVAAQALIDPARQQLNDVHADLQRMDEVAPSRQQWMSAEEREAFARDRDQLGRRLADANAAFEKSMVDLQALHNGLTPETLRPTARGLVVWTGNFLRNMQQAVLVQARARLESVSVEQIELTSEDAFEIALAQRFDFMNGRAALVDQWRQIQVAADALQSVLNLTAAGEVRTARNNPLSFRAPTGSAQVGVEFDAPLTRLLERNGYRETLIQYQRSRRELIQSGDALHLDVRALIREVAQLRENLEIQRRAVVIAIRRVDLTRAVLSAPVPSPPLGQRGPQFGPTAAFNLLSALASLRDTQNNFLRAWLDYYAARMRLARELGVMLLDQNGRWIESPLPSSMPDQMGTAPREELPPPLPEAAAHSNDEPAWDLGRLPPIRNEAEQEDQPSSIR